VKAGTPLDGLNPQTGSVRNQFELGVRGDPERRPQGFRND